VHHSLPLLRKCNNPRDHGHPSELPDLWPPNSLGIKPIDYKILGIIQQRVYQTKVQDWNDLRQRLVDVWCWWIASAGEQSGGRINHVLAGKTNRQQAGGDGHGGAREECDWTWGKI